MFWLPAVVFFPPLVLALCKYPTMQHVEVDEASMNVSWRASGEPGCLKGFQVCRTSMDDKGVSCALAPPDATSLRLPARGLRPCERFSVEVTALSRDPKGRGGDSRYAHGVAGPPPVTGLRLAQSSRELAALEWTPRPEGSCASGVELWLCDNSTQDPAACVHKTLLAGSSRFEFHGFEVCRRYHATVRATSGFRLSPPATLEVYLDTANAVARAEVRYVTHDSAVIEWWVSDVKSRCQEETMRVCVQEEGVGETPPDCWEWTLDQDGPRDSLAVGDLEPCAAYAATVSLIAAGRHSNKTVAFTTPMTAEALSATTEHVTNTAAEIRWSYDVSSSDCRPSVVRVCYSKLGSGDHRKMCRTSGTASRSSMHLADLLPCSSYNVSLVLITSVGPRPNCTLPLVTTSQGVPVLRSLDVTAAGRNVTVRWTPMGADLHCVRHYNVSWWSVPGFGRAHRTLEAGVTSLAIPGPLRRAAYHVEVTAVLTDGSSQALPGNFSTADSASMFAKFSLHLEMMPLIIVLLTLFQQ